MYKLIVYGILFFYCKLHLFNSRQKDRQISSVLFTFKLLYFEKIIGENGRFTHVWFVRS